MVRWLAAVTVLAVLAALAGWAAVAPEPRPEPLPTAATVDPAAVCREWGKAALAMGDRLERAFARHDLAHQRFQRGEIPMGPKEQPGTVLFIWHETLHERRVHAVHYRELRAAWRQSCLGDRAA